MLSRIKEVLAYSQLSTRAFAIKCGMNQPTLDRMLKGKNALSLNCVCAVLDTFPEISSEWLMRGVGDMLTSEATDQNQERLMKLVDTISLMQDAINSKTDTIKILTERIKKLESQTK